MTDTPNLVLPYIAASQAQKHVTHNEAIRLLDGMVQLSVLSRIVATPPGSPTDGSRYIVASGATGAWAGWDLNVAFWVDGAWMRLIPRVGWIAYSVADTGFYSWNGSAWVALSAGGGSSVFNDTTFVIQDNGDLTKQLKFELVGLTTGNTRTMTVPDASGTLALLGLTQTFSAAQTFSSTSNTFGGGVGSGTQELASGATNSGNLKTVNIATAGKSGSTTNIAIGSAVAGALGTLTVNSPSVIFATTVSSIAMASANVSALYLGLGGATADATNRLSLNAPASLFNHAGAGHQIKVNKNAAGDTASLLFQSGFSGRAEMGLTGSDDWTIKVSPDGSTYFPALVCDRTTGRPTFPQGEILGPLAADPIGRADGWLWYNSTTLRTMARSGGVDRVVGQLAGTGVLAVVDNAFEASTVISAPGVTSGSVILVVLGAALDSDENSPELLDLVTLWGAGGTDQITVGATFDTPTSGSININWSAL